LLGGSEADLPFAAIDSYSERFTGIKGMAFEAGATVAHLVA
jgi:hypothetical protein